LPNREYHWIITLTWPTARGAIRSRTQDGLYDSVDGQTRRAVFEQVYSDISGQAGVPNTAVVAFWSLEPNDL
jgi:membrane-bound lytic murein transglycosylase B